MFKSSTQKHVSLSMTEAEPLIVKWIAGVDNDSNMFTKNLNGPMFERFAEVYVGVDDYTPATK